MSFEFDSGSDFEACIKVVGVGGAGGNAINNMIEAQLAGVEFIVANTDAQALQKSLAPTRIQIGEGLTRGLGAGAKPDVGMKAAEESQERIREALKGADMVFITAGMGGGTGTGAAPVIARIANEMDVLTVAVVTKPFEFEGRKRMAFADAGLDELRRHVDTIITIPNQKLVSVSGQNTSMADAFRKADNVLYDAVRGITDLITVPGMINVDFADVRTVMAEMGYAMMGAAEASGDTRAVDAMNAAIASPLLDDVSMHGARGVLLNITGNQSISLREINEAAMMVREMAHEDAIIIFGTAIDERMENSLRITVVATGIGVADRVPVPVVGGRPSVVSPRSSGTQSTRVSSAVRTAPVVTAPVTPLRGEDPAAASATQPDAPHEPVRRHPSVRRAVDMTQFENINFEEPTFIRNGSKRQRQSL
jgi:cell division protein FtsZ